MADWVNISDTQVDPDAPITSELGYAFRDNPVALAEGATGAPRIMQAAIQNPIAGTFRTITSVTGSRGTTDTAPFILVKFAVITPGTIQVRTVTSNVSNDGGSVPSVSVSRRRNGNTTNIAEYNTNGTRNDNVSVQIGDVVISGLTSPGTTTITSNVQLLIGNDALAGVVVESNGV